MLTTAHAFTSQTDSQLAGADLGRHLCRTLADATADVVIVFASAQHDYAALLHALQDVSRPRLIIGCSSAGEFTSGALGVESACALALQDPDMRFAVSLGQGLRANRVAAARSLVAGFHGLGRTGYRYRTALVFADALAGYTDDLLEHLTLLTGGAYQFVGGGAGDDARFTQTHVFCGTEAYTDAVVALEILSQKPIGLGVAHGWSPASAPMRVTAATDMCLHSLNAAPAVEVFEEHAGATEQPLDRANPIPFFLHNVLGIQTGQDYKLRVPLGILDDGSVPCASDIPTGTLVHVMKASADSSVDAAAMAAQRAVAQLQGATPKVALFFDCVATRLRMGQAFDTELATVEQALAGAPYIGCNTYGQIARVEGQFSGFHNCTAVVCIFPE